MVESEIRIIIKKVIIVKNHIMSWIEYTISVEYLLMRT